MNKSVLIIHGFGPKGDDIPLLNSVSNAGFDPIYMDWFEWNDINQQKFEEEVSKYLVSHNIVGVIGISFGGIVVGQNITKFLHLPIFIIASAPYFNPLFNIKFIYTLPKPISIITISILKPIALVLSKTVNHPRVKGNASLISQLPMNKIIQILEFIKKADNRNILKNMGMI